MRVLKWTCDFHPNAETPYAPVWIYFLLFALSKIVGVPLRIDEATADLLRPREVRVYVEINLEHKLPDRIWIDGGASCSFWQPIAYNSLPHFCAKCRRMGHVIDHSNKHVDAPVPIVDGAGKGKEKEVVVEVPRQWVLVTGSSSVVTIPSLVVHVGPIFQLYPTIPIIVASKPFHDAVFLIQSLVSFSILLEPVHQAFDIDPHVSPHLSSNENVEASIPFRYC
ncbi:DUF4283 domain-containing protein [Abeliophyllum distichum]|uniref:DUF4283 domain-containing protein n=1 Tax=Abeliophyllum distichum TaxID=126358 RepID=A0ABD1UMR1_9LAMI